MIAVQGAGQTQSTLGPSPPPSSPHRVPQFEAKGHPSLRWQGLGALTFRGTSPRSWNSSHLSPCPRDRATKLRPSAWAKCQRR